MSESPAAYWCEIAYVDRAARASVLLTVEDGRFSAVEVGAAAPPGAERLHGLSLPGFANTHSHAFHRALRSRTQRDGGTFWTWRDVMYRAAERLDPDRYLALATATFAEMALAGVTTVGEFHYVHHQPNGQPYDDPNEMGGALREAATRAGVRITLLDTVYLHGGWNEHGHVAPGGVQRRFSDGTVGAWTERVERRRPDDRCRLGAAIHSVRAVDPPSIAAVSRWAAAHGAPLHAHVSEQVAENEQCVAATGRTPTQLLAEGGAIDDRFTAIHATHLTQSDVALLGEGATVCMCPTTERDLGDGIGPTSELRARGVPLALGSDSHAVIDMFEEARAMELDERLRTQTRGIHRANELLEAATSNGHRSLGWSDVGTIAVGQRADLVTVALDSPRTAGSGMDNGLEAAMFAATAGDVRRVMIEGRLIAEHGRHRNIDVASELARSIADIMED